MENVQVKQGDMNIERRGANMKEKILKIMKSKKITQRQLAEKIGICKNALCNKINGKTDFTVTEAAAICRVLDITDNAAKAEIFLSG